MNLYPHQVKALEDTAGKPNALYALDMGLGKTFVGTEKMRQIGNRVNLVVCQKSKIGDWIEHLKSHYGYCAVFDLTDNDALNDFLHWESSNDFLEVGDYRCPRIGVINYELLFRRPQLKQLKGFTLMLDESSLIQNESTRRARFILKMNYANVILLSGTVVNGNYEKLWSQCNLLGWRIPKELFYRHYVEFDVVERDGFKIKVPRGYKNVDRLKRKLREYGGVFVKTEEVIELPEQRDVFVWVDRTRDYDKFCKTRTIDLNERELLGDYKLTERMYKKMLCSQWNPHKLQAFRDLVDSTDDRLVVFYTYTEELLEMMKVCLDHTFSIVNGSKVDLESYECDPQSITFVQYQAGAMGLNLQKANKMIYFSLPDGWSEGFEQSRKRIHRIGQQRPCTYYILMTRHTIEEEIWSALMAKGERTNYLFEEVNDEGEGFRD